MTEKVIFLTPSNSTNIDKSAKSASTKFGVDCIFGNDKTSATVGVSKDFFSVKDLNTGKQYHINKPVDFHGSINHNFNDKFSATGFVSKCSGHPTNIGASINYSSNNNYAFGSICKPIGGNPSFSVGFLSKF
jgi:hypothetical protein